MANIPNPNLNVDEFETSQRETIATWRAIAASGVGRDVQRRAACAALSSTATNWEWFRSEWHKKAISRDATAYRAALIDKVRHLVNESDEGRKFLKALDDSAVTLDVRLARLPGIENVSRIVDPADGNITFRGQAASDRTADKHLAPVYAARAKSLTHDDWLVIGVMIAVRNVLAHSSTRSVNAMNQAIESCRNSGDPVVLALGRDANRVTRSGIGAYLLAESQGVRRVDRICQRVLSLAPAFRI